MVQAVMQAMGSNEEWQMKLHLLACHSPPAVRPGSLQARGLGTPALNDTLDQMDLIYIYRTFHPKAAEYTFLSSAHGTFSRIDHILGHKTSLNKFKKIEIISSVFSDHNAMILEINYRKILQKT